MTDTVQAMAEKLSTVYASWFVEQQLAVPAADMKYASALLLSLQAEKERMERDLFKAVLARAHDYVEVGEVTNNNQHGWDNIVTTGPNVTLGVGLKVFALRTDLPTPVLDTLFNNEAARESARGSECWCHGCKSKLPSKAMPGLTAINDQMILCPDCGNKRCPKATHHDNACTGSNDVGQAGSVYGYAELSRTKEQTK